MSKEKFIQIGTASFNVEESRKHGHALFMKTWKDLLPKGILAQAEAELFPEEVAAREEAKEEKDALKKKEAAEEKQLFPEELKAPEDMYHPSEEAVNFPKVEPEPEPKKKGKQ